MEHLVIKYTAKPMSAFKAAQQRSIVSYYLPSDFSSQSPACIYIEEARNLLAARGTTGLRVWDASLHLAYFLSTEGASMVHGKTVLELGAGTGLLSILCAGALKAAKVIATDGDADVVDNIQSNADLNPAILGKPPDKRKLEAKVLDWADIESLPKLLKQEGKELSLDVILGADITYAIESLEPLVTLLSALNGEYPEVDIIISTVVRNADTFSTFLEICAKAGFHISSIPFDCPSLGEQRGFFHKTTPPIRIVRLGQHAAVSLEDANNT